MELKVRNKYWPRAYSTLNSTALRMTRSYMQIPGKAVLDHIVNVHCHPQDAEVSEDIIREGTPFELGSGTVLIII
jgi:hypothetical protein